MLADNLKDKEPSRRIRYYKISIDEFYIDAH